MNENVELLNYIYQNSSMGVSTIQHLLGIVKEEKLVELLKIQLKEYEYFADESEKQLHQEGKQAKDINKLQELMTSVSIDVKTMMDKSASNIVEMMLQGSLMGIIDAIKNLKKYKNADLKVVELMNALLQEEENNIESLKKLLYELEE